MNQFSHRLSMGEALAAAFPFKAKHQQQPAEAH